MNLTPNQHFYFGSFLTATFPCANVRLIYVEMELNIMIAKYVEVIQ